MIPQHPETMSSSDSDQEQGFFGQLPWWFPVFIVLIVAALVTNAYVAARSSEEKQGKRRAAAVEMTLIQLYGTTEACYGELAVERTMGITARYVYRVIVTEPDGQKAFCDCSELDGSSEVRDLAEPCECFRQTPGRRSCLFDAASCESTGK